ncbi:MAG TPA: enoyl-CoA hydratase/isomerase family protein [Longimicrobiales bacterium]|nr:enoyl-CoA hydratase/isomerase family protein [Longimicrobiales bacterium]
MDEAEPAPVLTSRDGAILWIQLNRPDRLNAVSRPLYELLTDTVADADADLSVRVVVLTGTGRAFCAGADLKAHAAGPPSPQERRQYARSAQRANRTLQTCGKPVIAAVNGAAVGAGLELALSCDFMVAAADAKLRLPELALGTFFGGGVAHTLPQRVGLGKARELLFLGDFFTGADAAAMGLALAAVSAESLEDTVRSLATKLAERAPAPVRLAKQLLRRAPRMSLRAVLREEERALLQCMATRDWAEGAAAMAEKRAPRYTGE